MVVTETARVAEATMVVTLVVMEVEAARVVMETARVRRGGDDGDDAGGD